MKLVTTLKPSLVGRFNERQIVRLLQTNGPLSRAELSRLSGLSAPTVSKAIVTLVEAGFLEETDVTENSRGRPANKIRLAIKSAQIGGILLDREHSYIMTGGLDGKQIEVREVISNPDTYAKLMDLIEQKCRPWFIGDESVKTMAIGICTSGLIDAKENQVILSPNIPILNNRRPANDLTSRLGITCVILQELQGLCLAEKYFGGAKEYEDIVVIEAETGMGIGAMINGKLLRGHDSMCGELGHVVMGTSQHMCGCGKIGCLEMSASMRALANYMAEKTGKQLTIDEAYDLCIKDPKKYAKEISIICEGLGLAASLCLNVFNPQAIFIHSRILDVEPTALEQITKKAKTDTLQAIFERSKIEISKTDKQHGAISAALLHVTDSLAKGVV